MSQNAFDVLNKLITSNKYSTSTKNKNGLFYNDKGPSAIQSGGGGDIYIECTPTGASGESLVPIVGTGVSQSLLNFSAVGLIGDNLFFKIFIGILVIYLIMKVGNIILGKIFDIQSGGGVSLQIGGKVHK
jgi:hypothetical protein